MERNPEGHAGSDIRFHAEDYRMSRLGHQGFLPRVLDQCEDGGHHRLSQAGITFQEAVREDVDVLPVLQ